MDEVRALCLQTIDNVAVVDDLVADVDRGAIDGERTLHSVDRPHHAGAEAPWRAKHDFQGFFGLHGSDPGPNHPSPPGRERSIRVSTWDGFRAVSRPISSPLRGQPPPAYIGP